MNKELEALEKIKTHPVELHIKEGWDISLYEEEKENFDLIEEALEEKEKHDKVLNIGKNIV